VLKLFGFEHADNHRLSLIAAALRRSGAPSSSADFGAVVDEREQNAQQPEVAGVAVRLRLIIHHEWWNRLYVCPRHP
jgi:hypothetical protein